MRYNFIGLPLLRLVPGCFVVTKNCVFYLIWFVAKNNKYSGNLVVFITIGNNGYRALNGYSHVKQNILHVLNERFYSNLKKNILMLIGQIVIFISYFFSFCLYDRRYFWRALASSPSPW